MSMFGSCRSSRRSAFERNCASDFVLSPLLVSALLPDLVMIGLSSAAAEAWIEAVAAPETASLSQRRERTLTRDAHNKRVGVLVCLRGLSPCPL